jgi:DNA (cytosine-5)-methyltransferase 1
MESFGYKIEPVCIPACCVKAWHKRDRIWIVAYLNNSSTEYKIQTGRDVFTSKITSNFNSKRLQKFITPGKKQQRRVGFNRISMCEVSQKINQAQAFICRGDDGIPDRMDRIKGLGNAIVPQVAFEIFKAIEQNEQ